MAKIKYGIIERETPRKLLVVPHRNGDLTVSYPAFGPNSLKANIRKIRKSYSHPITGKKISLREPTTSESISAFAYEFDELEKPQIERYFHLGPIVKTSGGVFVNPPKDADGSPIIDERTLKSRLDRARKVNGIYLLDDDFGFAPYETFNQGMQDPRDFSESGLARVLEHTEEKTAKILGKIASSGFYRHHVAVSCFSDVKEPTLRILGLTFCLSFGLDAGKGGLFVDGYWGAESRFGYVFGVLNKTSKAGSQKI